MTFVDVLLEAYTGLKMGARYSVSKNHNMTETAIQPRLGKIGKETFSR